MFRRTMIFVLCLAPALYGQAKPVKVAPERMKDLLEDLASGSKKIAHLPDREVDLAEFIQQKGGPQKASADVVQLWSDGKIESLPASRLTAYDEPSPCVQAQRNLQQQQNAVLISNTFAWGLAVVCFSTGGPAVNPGVCGIGLAAQGLALYGQYQVSQAQQAVAQACGGGE